jgi:zinc transporter ZupT
VLSALLWGAVAASSLVIGAVLGVIRRWDNRLIGAVLGFGAGALISSVSFELIEEGLATAGGLPVALGLATGALAFFLGDRGVERMGGRSGGGAAAASRLRRSDTRRPYPVRLGTFNGYSILRMIPAPAVTEDVQVAIDLVKRVETYPLPRFGRVATADSTHRRSRLRDRSRQR